MGASKLPISVASPLTGKVERYEKLPFQDKPQYKNNTFVDDFLFPKLDLEWTFIRVPQKNTYSRGKKRVIRLYTKPGTIENRKRFSMIGFRQRESDFEYQVKMEFAPKDDKAESGIIHYQKNGIIFQTLSTKKINDFT